MLREQVYVCGLDNDCKVVDFSVVDKVQSTIMRLWREANTLRNNNAQIENVYAFGSDNRDACAAYKSMVRNKKFEDRVVFKVLLEQVGVCLN